MNAGYVILTLKVAVIAVTVLLAVSLLALVRGNYRLHGRLNVAFFILTLAALVGLEVVARLLSPDLFVDYLNAHDARDALRTHLMFSMPAAVLLLFMLPTGWQRRRNLHITMGLLFLVLWAGTFVTGVFYLPHELP
jgi:uncharacterized membrane protein YozB (DUF420 family)